MIKNIRERLWKRNKMSVFRLIGRIIVWILGIYVARRFYKWIKTLSKKETMLDDSIEES